MQGIYKFTNKVNGKVYIGKSINLESRKSAHLRNYDNPNCEAYKTRFYTAVRKYGGFDNFSYEVLESSDNWTDKILNEKEIEYIALYDATNSEKGYNTLKGGKDTAVPRKLTELDVIEIKDKLKNSNLTMEEIGIQYGINGSMVGQINRGQTWHNTGSQDYPIRKDTFIRNKGETNPKAKMTNREVMEIRLSFVDMELNDIYEDYKDKLSFSELKKICYGSQFKSLPIYKKRQQQWFLNGTCIDYPRIEEY